MGGIKELYWDEANEEHIARHHVTSYEVEEVCFAKNWMLRASGRKRKAVFGQTVSGRYLLVILEMSDYDEYYVITARDMDQAERRRYQAWKGRR
jgi:uncharacterized DUF497 family protein